VTVVDSYDVDNENENGSVKINMDGTVKKYIVNPSDIDDRIGLEFGYDHNDFNTYYEYNEEDYDTTEGDEDEDDNANHECQDILTREEVSILFYSSANYIASTYFNSDRYPLWVIPLLNKYFFEETKITPIYYIKEKTEIIHDEDNNNNTIDINKKRKSIISDDLHYSPSEMNKDNYGFIVDHNVHELIYIQFITLSLYYIDGIDYHVLRRAFKFLKSQFLKCDCIVKSTSFIRNVKIDYEKSVDATTTTNKDHDKPITKKIVYVNDQLSPLYKKCRDRYSHFFHFIPNEIVEIICSVSCRPESKWFYIEYDIFELLSIIHQLTTTTTTTAATTTKVIHNNF
jgi:hypothetical protein